MAIKNALRRTKLQWIGAALTLLVFLVVLYHFGPDQEDVLEDTVKTPHERRREFAGYTGEVKQFSRNSKPDIDLLQGGSNDQLIRDGDVEPENLKDHSTKFTQLCYSRIPKTGSSGTVGTLRAVNRKHGNIPLTFKSLHDVRFPRVYAQDDYGRNFTQGLRGAKQPWLMYPHYHFLDFQSLGPGFEGMTYFSVIRDPVSRTVSHFNYLRHHPQYAKEWFKTKRDEQMSIDECFQGRHAECTTRSFYLAYTVFYFCGYHEICSRGDESSLNLAKQNFERFEVVGILEELDDFWVMMESTFPQYFTGALAKYRADVKSNRSKTNKTKYLFRPSNETRTLMRDALALDIEFYEWAKQRVHERMAKLKS